MNNERFNGFIEKGTLFFKKEEWSIAVNFKVFSSSIARALNEGRSTHRPHFTMPSTGVPPTKKIALLVGSPILKFFSACREDKILPEIAIKVLQDGKFPSLHFFPQCRYINDYNLPVFCWKAPDHLSEFWEELKLGTPPEVYPAKQTFDLEDKLREIYSRDFELYDGLRSPKQLASLSKAIVPTAPLTRQIPTALRAVARFARSGFTTTPLTILANREATCRACPEWDAAALNGTGRCRKCGCSTWAKLRMATERCPIGKWEAVPPAP